MANLLNDVYAGLSEFLGEPWERAGESAVWQCLSPRLERFQIRLERRPFDGAACIRFPGGRSLGDLGHILFLCIDHRGMISKLVGQLRRAGIRGAPRGLALATPGRHTPERPAERRYEGPPHSSRFTPPARP
ncbi:MAG: hypothetical protein WD749_14615 [Phycisphaerales bacterium]